MKKSSNQTQIPTSPIAMSFNPTRGRLEADVKMAKYSWLRVGGRADYFFRPADEAELIQFLRQKPADLPIEIMGAASNLIIRDGGVRGVVIRIGTGISSITKTGSLSLRVGAGALDMQLARYATIQGISGLEFLIGIPGSVGGAVAMNAGAYDCDMKGILHSIEGVTFEGERKTYLASELEMTYRHTKLPPNFIITYANINGTHLQDKKIIQERMQIISQSRDATQPVRYRTGGSTFKNPVSGLKAWQLIDKAGGRGLKVGDAQMSEMHCNFMINNGNATSQDIELLGENIINLVKEKMGVELEWELIKIGQAADLSLENKNHNLPKSTSKQTLDKIDSMRFLEDVISQNKSGSNEH